MDISFKINYAKNVLMVVHLAGQVTFALIVNQDLCFIGNIHT